MAFAFWGQECKVVVDEADGDRAIADGGGHTFDRAVPGIADGEHARDGRLQRERGPLQGPVLTSVGSGEDESPLVALYRLGQPAGALVGSTSTTPVYSDSTGPAGWPTPSRRNATRPSGESL